MIKKQSIAFDKMANNYNKFVQNLLSTTGFDVNYVTWYKVNDFNFELNKYSVSFENLNILDYGCGIGMSSPFLQSFFRKSQIFACDISETSIENAIKNNKNIKNITYKHFDGISLPFCEKFDAIFIANVLRHIPRENHNYTISMLKKSLKKNGIIFMWEFNPYNPVALYFYHKADCDYDKNNVKIMSPGYSKKLYQRAGFQNIEIKYRFYIPNKFKKLIFLENYLKNIPLGANYYLVAQNT